MIRIKRTLALAVMGLALVWGGHATVSAAPLFEAREQIANVASISGMGFLLPLSASAAPGADIWPRWQQHDPSSPQTIDHTIWDTFVKTYVIAAHPSGINRVRYDAVTPADRQALRRYLATMQAVPISTYNRHEQQAYWINLYNALTVHLILAHYPVESIRDIDISRAG